MTGFQILTGLEADVPVIVYPAGGADGRRERLSLWVKRKVDVMNGLQRTLDFIDGKAVDLPPFHPDPQCDLPRSTPAWRIAIFVCGRSARRRR
ncbi:MAG: hypothetical protein ACOX52_16235 [Verrucomicrobiota bacterium]